MEVQILYSARRQQEYYCYHAKQTGQVFVSNEACPLSLRTVYRMPARSWQNKWQHRTSLRERRVCRPVMAIELQESSEPSVGCCSTVVSVVNISGVLVFGVSAFCIG
jgi:hypothetical protein